MLVARDLERLDGLGRQLAHLDCAKAGQEMQAQIALIDHLGSWLGIAGRAPRGGEVGEGGGDPPHDPRE